jgi:hypothetical protein
MTERVQGGGLAMKLIETTILETTVRMRFADNADPAKAIEWLEFQVPLAALKVPDSEVELPLEKLNARYLGSIRQAALQHARQIIAAEIPKIVTR